MSSAEPSVDINDSSTAELGGGQVRKKSTNSSFSPVQTVTHFLFSGIFTPDRIAYEPIDLLLNEEDADQRDELTRRWRDHKLEELNFVGIVAALLAGVLTSTGSWPNINPTSDSIPWSVRTTFYAGIILSLFSILTSASQTIRLHRISSHRDALLRIRRLLAGRDKQPGARLRPRKAQVYAWQLPVTFLSAAVLCMIIGMFVHVWSATEGWRQLGDGGWWNSNSKMAVTFTIIALFCIGAFVGGHISLYEGEGPGDDVD